MTCGMRKRTPPTDRKTCHPFKPRGGVAQKKSHIFHKVLMSLDPIYKYISSERENLVI